MTKSQFKIALIIWPSRKRLMTLLLKNKTNKTTNDDYLTSNTSFPSINLQST